MTFQNAIKEEIEQYTESQRKQNLETVTIMKSVSTTMKKFKNEQTSLRMDE